MWGWKNCFEHVSQYVPVSLGRGKNSCQPIRINQGYEVTPPIESIFGPQHTPWTSSSWCQRVQMASIARADNCKECPTLNSLLWSRWNLTQGWLLRGVPSRLLCHAQNRSKWVKMGQESCRVANDLKISPPLPLHLPSKLHNKIKPPYVRLSSS